MEGVDVGFPGGGREVRKGRRLLGPNSGIRARDGIPERLTVGISERAKQPSTEN